jgi:hypothetical protein
MKPRLLAPLLLIALVAAASGLPRMAPASSVEAISFERLAAQATLVFEGRVRSQEVRRQRQGPKAWIWTCLRFEVKEVVKGSVATPELELCFLGGTLGADTLSVSDMAYPKVGERGVFFVARPGRLQANPLLGWDQGRFPINDSEEVCAANGKPVVGLSRDAGRRDRLSNGVARGVRVQGDPSQPGARGLSPDAFKRRIREIRDRSGR